RGRGRAGGRARRAAGGAAQPGAGGDLPGAGAEVERELRRAARGDSRRAPARPRGGIRLPARRPARLRDELPARGAARPPLLPSLGRRRGGRVAADTSLWDLSLCLTPGQVPERSVTPGCRSCGAIPRGMATWDLAGCQTCTRERDGTVTTA